MTGKITFSRIAIGDAADMATTDLLLAVMRTNSLYCQSSLRNLLQLDTQAPVTLQSSLRGPQDFQHGCS